MTDTSQPGSRAERLLDVTRGGDRPGRFDRHQAAFHDTADPVIPSVRGGLLPR
jgi:hypothetical protein